MDFKYWLENYREIDSEEEERKVRRLNMTGDLPLIKKGPVFSQLGKLTRGFHLNTVIGRMMQPWAAGLKRAPANPENMLKWRISLTDKAANDNYKAAYDMFKQEIANAVDALPFKMGRNVLSGEIEDILLKSKDFLANYRSEGKNLIDAMNSAWKIHTSVFGSDPKKNYGQIQNFMNFLQLVKDEFMTVGEILPSLEKSHEIEKVDDEFVKILNNEINKYYQLISNS
jgi:hypothetical protein